MGYNNNVNFVVIGCRTGDNHGDSTFYRFIVKVLVVLADDKRAVGQVICYNISALKDVLSRNT